VIKKINPEESTNKKILIEKLFGIAENYFRLKDEIKEIETKNEDITKKFFRLTENGGLFCGSIWGDAYTSGVLFNNIGDTIFVGYWEDNFPNLKIGKLFQYSSSKNETYFKNDYNIFISYSPKGEVYCGNHKHNIRSGEGVYVWTSNDLYKGTWQEGNRTGKGTFLWSNGDKYEGDFIAGDRTGYGKYTFATGGVWEGNWQNSKFTGIGKQISKNGDITVGQFENGNLTKTKETLNQEGIDNNSTSHAELENMTMVLTTYQKIFDLSKDSKITSNSNNNNNTQSQSINSSVVNIKSKIYNSLNPDKTTVIGCYFEGKIYSSEYPDRSKVVGCINDGKIYNSLNPHRSSVVGCFNEGKIYNSLIPEKTSVVGCFEGTGLGPAAAAALLLNFFY
jgi:hypothetical protein